MSTHRKYDAFICYYRRTGAALAQLFRANLEARGLRIFLDVKADYWGPFPSELKERVSDTPYFIVLLTNGCLDSPWLKLEIAEALKTQRKILVVRDANFAMPPEDALDPVLQALSMLNHITYIHDFNDEVVRRVAALVSDGAAARPRRSVWARASLALALFATVTTGIAFAWAERSRMHRDTATPAQTLTAAPPSAPQTSPKPAGAPAPSINSEPHPKILVQTTEEPSPVNVPRKNLKAPLVATPKPAAPSIQRAEDPCALNFWLDQYGEKHYKPECFTSNKGGATK